MRILPNRRKTNRGNYRSIKQIPWSSQTISSVPGKKLSRQKKYDPAWHDAFIVITWDIDVITWDIEKTKHLERKKSFRKERQRFRSSHYEKKIAGRGTSGSASRF